MIKSIAFVSIYVRDYDEALAFFTDKMGLELRGDRHFGEGERWVTVGAKGQPGIDLVLHVPRGNGHSHASGIGKQPPIVFLTDDCHGEVARFKEKGIVVTKDPEQVPWGIQAMFVDLCGNTHVLVQPSAHESDGGE